MVFPSSAAILQNKLGIAGCPAFDVQAVCSGFIYGMAVADSMIRTGAARTVLLIGAETMSRLLDWSDRTTCVLFGDGAGAVLLEAGENGYGIMDALIRWRRMRGARAPLNLCRRKRTRSAHSCD